MTAYELIDKNGKTWGIYRSYGAAERAAMINNEDIRPEIESASPFDVRETWVEDME